MGEGLNQSEAGEQEADETSLKEHVTADTKGLNLAEGIDEMQRSFVATEQIKAEIGEMYYDPAVVENLHTDVDRERDENTEGNQGNLDGLNADATLEPDLIQRETIELVQTTWGKMVEVYGVEKIGVVLFKNIFKIAPGAVALFPFKNAADIYTDKVFLVHATTVASTVGTAVSLLEDLATLVPVLQDLGFSHAKRGILPEHYPIVGQALKNTLKAGLKQNWNKHVSQAWEYVYSIVQ